MNAASLAVCGRLFLAVLSTSPQQSTLEVRHRDLDMFQHVNSATFLSYLGDSLSEISSRIAPPLDSINGESAIPVQSVEIDFKHPLKQDAPVDVRWTSPSDIPDGRLSFLIQSRDRKEPNAEGRLNSLILTDPALNLPRGMEPVFIERSVDVRFHDLDTRQQVDYSQYLDYLNTISWHHLRENHNITPKDILGKGIGFFMRRAEMEFDSPVKGIKKIRIKTWLAQINNEGTELVFPYEIRDEKGDELHSQGKIYYTVVDLTGAQPKKTAFPEGLQRYFLKGSKFSVESSED